MSSLRNVNATIFALFILSGAIKSALPFVLPVDITVVFTALSVVLLLVNILFRSTVVRVHLILILLLLIFFGSYLLSYLGTLSPQYATSKLFGLGLNVIAFIFPLLVCFNTRRFLEVFIFITFIVASISILGRIFLPYSLYGDYLRQLYLSAGLLTGFVVLSTLSKSFGVPNKFLFLFFTLILLLLGARGPLIFCFLVVGWYAVIVAYSYRWKICSFKKNEIFYFLVLSFSLIFLFLANYDIFESQLLRTLNRLMLLLADNKGESVNERIEYLTVALSMFSESPLFGTGLGSFSFYYLGLDARAYPHNIFLELSSESGLITLSAFFLFLTMVFIYCRKSPVFLGILLYSILNMSKSNAFEDLRIHFCFMALCVLCSPVSKFGKGNK